MHLLMATKMASHLEPGEFAIATKMASHLEPGEFAIPCAWCLKVNGFRSSSLAKFGLTVADVKWRDMENPKFVDLEWLHPPAAFKKLKAYKKASACHKSHEEYKKDGEEALPNLMKKGTLEMQERKRKAGADKSRRSKRKKRPEQV